jgi:hypothetical protein
MRGFQGHAAPLAALLLTAILAGCTYQPPQNVVDFSSVDENQSGGSFELRVRVIGLNNDSMPLSGAFVGVAQGTQAVAKATTDSTGVATLRLRAGQTITVVGQAAGWTTEDSGPIRIGRASSEQTSIGAGAGCAGSASNSRDGQFAVGGCVVTSGSGSHEAGYNLDGDRGQVSIVLFPQHVQQVFDESAGARVNLRITTAPDGQGWLALHRPLQQDPTFHNLHMMRFHNATTTLVWTNALAAQADWELGVGCGREEPQVETDDTVPRLVAQGENRLVLEFQPESSGRWSSCETYRAGPLIDTLNLPVSFQLTNELTFRGRSTIIPIQ